MKQLSESHKIDIGLVGQTLSATNATGAYHSMAGVKRALAIMKIGALAATKTCILQIMQATDAAATSAKVITGAACTVTANTLVTKVNVALASTSTGDLVVVNGVTYTQAAATSVADREFLDAAGLVLCINNATYGVTGVLATASTTNVILTASAPGDTVLTVVSTDVGGTVVTSTLEALGFVEIRGGDMDTANSFDHIACKVTSTGAGIDDVTLIREMCETPTQKVGASTMLKAT